MVLHPVVGAEAVRAAAMKFCEVAHAVPPSATRTADTPIAATRRRQALAFRQLPERAEMTCRACVDLPLDGPPPPLMPFPRVCPGSNAARRFAVQLKDSMSSSDVGRPESPRQRRGALRALRVARESPTKRRWPR